MLDVAETQNPVLPSITLAQAIPKGKNMDWIIQKSVELGVSNIIPLITDRTIANPGDDKVEKWRRVALEACKQCGQNYLPEISQPISLTRWLSNQTPSQLSLIASLTDAAKPFRETLLTHRDLASVTILIGPEGDFTSAETKAALAANFQPITLGSLVLRVETAALFTISAIRYQFAEPPIT